MEVGTAVSKVVGRLELIMFDISNMRINDISNHAGVLPTSI